MLLAHVIGLGANLGDRAACMRQAAEALGAIDGVTLVARSSIVESAAVGPPQPGYLNAAVLVRASLDPIDLLDRCHAIEHALGRRREREVRWGARVIDLDLLWADGTCIDVPRLVLPHPRLSERPFAVQPLIELVPDACDPTTRQRYAELAAARVSLARAGAL